MRHRIQGLYTLMVTWRVCALALILVSTAPGRLIPVRGIPLWPGSAFTEADRARAIDRGLTFIYRTAVDPANFSLYGSDYLWCFYEIAATSSDRRLSERAAAMGRERAERWRVEHPHPDPKASPDDLADVLFGAYAAEQLGFPDEALKNEIRNAAAHFTGMDFLRFAPAAGPRQDDPALHDLLCDALITTYTADQYQVTLGAPYRDAARWLTLARPYRIGADGVIPVVNLVTHVVYTVNDYGAKAISPAAFPDEFAFLREHFMDREIQQDGEMLGEFMDCLRAFGLTARDPMIQRGYRELLSTQNIDGSWGDLNKKDIYDRYHPTWTAIDGLRDYRWRTGSNDP
jgi:hypothetical protein